MQKKYFAASNSSQGFKNYYPEVFARADFIYIVKGGPGTGKSSFMKRCSRRAEDRGCECEYYYCSSDPSSLDGVLIFDGDKTIGILDGTAPHISEPRFPGACEEIVNLGQFWNSELLKKQKKEIIALSERKSAEYRSAYTYLRSVGNLRAVADGLLDEVIEKDKMIMAASRMLREFPDASNDRRHNEVPSLIDSVSMSGRVRMDTFEKNALKLYLISDFYGVGRSFLDEIYRQLKSKGISLRVSFDPICPSHTDGLFVEDNKTAFLLYGNGELKDDPFTLQGDASEKDADSERIFINSRRFADVEGMKNIRSELRYTAKLAQSSLEGALHSLSKAKIYHFLLEDIYGKAMDWKGFERFDVEI